MVSPGFSVNFWICMVAGIGKPGPKPPKSYLATVAVVKEMLDRASAVPVRMGIRAMTIPVEIFLLRVIQLTPVRLGRLLREGRRTAATRRHTSGPDIRFTFYW